MRKKIASLLVVVLIAIPGQPTAAQSKSWTPFYMTTWNATTRLSTIWQYMPGDHGATPLFVFQNTTHLTSELFSLQELVDLRMYEKNNPDPREGSGESYAPFQGIDSLWRFDATHLLIMTSNYINKSAADFSATFGYYEFLTIDIAPPHTIQSLFKIDYHDRILEDGGNDGVLLSVRNVALNPTQSKVAVVLGAKYFSSTTLIVDYSGSPAQFTRLPLVSNPVWSPDGTRLSYTMCTNYSAAKRERCDFYLQILTIRDGTITTVDLLPKVENWLFTGNVVWADNNTLMYEWYPASAADGGDVASIFKVNQLNSQTTLEIGFVDQLGRGHLYTLTNSGIPHVIVGLGSGTGNGFALSIQSPFNVIGSIGVDGEVSYNSRYPERILVFPPQPQKNDNGQVVAIDANLNQLSIDLSKILPQDEWVGYGVTP